MPNTLISTGNILWLAIPNKFGSQCIYSCQHRIQQPGGGGGQETWNLCGRLWQPPFLWRIFTGLGPMTPWPPRSATGCTTVLPKSWFDSKLIGTFICICNLWFLVYALNTNLRQRFGKLIDLFGQRNDVGGKAIQNGVAKPLWLVGWLHLAPITNTSMILMSEA